MRNLFAALCLFFAPAAALADGGVLLQRWESGDLALYLFAKPAPLRAGPAEFEIMVQDLKTGVPQLDGKVLLTFENSAISESADAWVPPCCRQHVPDGSHWEVAASPSAHGNRLCFSAPTIFPSSGGYRVLVNYESGLTRVSGGGNIQVSSPLPPVVEYWPLMGLPLLALGLFCANRVAAAR